jgi:hypothetical protein
MKRKRISPEEWARWNAENESVARRLEERIARIQAELDEKRAATRRPVARRRLFGLP